MKIVGVLDSNKEFDKKGRHTTWGPRCVDIGSVVGVVLLVVIPTVHMGINKYIWVPNKETIDRSKCRCGCWDTVFKGSYENPPAGYKHFYFNTTRNIFWIWLLTIIALITFYEIVKHLVNLWQISSLRPSYLALFLSVIYSHYYSWWVYIGYLNDDFYSQWYHQLFFTITELISTGLVIHLCDRRNEITSPKLFSIILIACVHISVGGLDQFIKQLFLLSEGFMFQRARNLGFMIPDIFHIIIPVTSLMRSPRHKVFSQIGCAQILFFTCAAIILTVVVHQL